MAENVSMFSQGSTLMSVIFGFFMSGIFNEMVKTYLPLQLSLHFPILDVFIPAVIMMLYKNFVPVVNFDLMNEFKIYIRFLEFLS